MKKNIYLIPTDKPSKLVTRNDKPFVLMLKEHSPFATNETHTWKNTYITNDEVIKAGDYFWKPDCNMIFKAEYTPHKGCEKVILTTDQELIKDGVQAIDDDFLEWFVKNPSCEFVEVKKGSYNLSPMEEMLEKEYVPKGTFDTYKIIISQEEPKQYPIGGYAPGYYSCTCITCKKEFTGDKRAVQCEPCAIEMIQEEPKEELELKDFETGDILDVLNMGNVEYLSNGDIIYNPNLFFVKRGDKWFIKTK
jgi:hypothetical protein